MENHEPCSQCSQLINLSDIELFSYAVCPHCSEHILLKSNVGAYQIQKAHARGGMSVLYYAIDTKLNREVALKVLNESYSSDQKRMDAFETEALITASLNHDRVVKIFTTGKAYGHFYIAMEWVSGTHLEAIIEQQGSLSETEVAKIAAHVLDGLAEAEKSGLLHRDIKPGNIMIDDAGQVKIVDFGLALVTKGGSVTADEIWATPHYVSPETLLGHAENFNSDIYSLGATLYHALTGIPTCDFAYQSTNELLEAKKNIPSIATLAPWLSDQCIYLIDRCMQYHSKDRFNNYQEIQDLVQCIILNVKWVNPELIKKNEKRRNYFFIAFTSIGVAACILLGLLPYFQKEDPIQTEALAENQTITSNSLSSNNALLDQYYQAYNQLRRTDYKLAKNIFIELFNNQNMQEPTRTGCGTEAVICAYLNGDPKEARRLSELVISHIYQSSSSTQDSLNHLLSLLSNLSPSSNDLNIAQTSFANVSQSHLCLTILALKHWNKGEIKESYELWQQIISNKTPNAPQHISFYTEIAQDYIHDYKILDESHSIQLDSMHPDQKNILADTLHTKLQTLKTKGRAHFQLKLLIKQLRQSTT